MSLAPTCVVTSHRRISVADFCYPNRLTQLPYLSVSLTPINDTVNLVLIVSQKLIFVNGSAGHRS